MKKTLLIALISALTISSAQAEQKVEDMYSNVLHIQQNFFESAVAPGVPVIEEKTVTNEDELSTSDLYNDKKDRYVEHMPFFKLNRLRLLKLIRDYNVKADEKQRQLEEERLKKEEAELDNTQDSSDIKKVEYSEKTETETKNQSQNPELVGAIQQQVTENEMLLDCNEIQYDEETGDVKAIGSPVLEFPPQNIKVTADLITYNRNSNIIKALGNVVLTKDGNPVYGDYIQINMNEENVFMDNLKTGSFNVKITAKNGVSEEGKLILNKGSVVSDREESFILRSHMLGPDFTEMIIDPKDRSDLFTNELAKIDLNASQVNIDAGKSRDTFQVKDAEVFYNKKYLFTLPSFTAYTNKKKEYFEANYPEFGSRSNLGSFIGPGFVVPGPNGSIFKLVPFINYQNKIGFGGAIKFKSAFNNTEFLYGSSNNIFVLKGKQILDENLYLQYGANTYMDDWFMGYRMPKYLAELIYEKETELPDFLAKNRGLTYKHRAAVGYAHDGDWNMRSESIQSSNISTMRVKYMAEAKQLLFSKRDEVNRKIIDLSMILQGSAAVYGTGDTQFVGRIGPQLHTQYKYWMQDIGFFLTGYSDNTPMPVFDSYRYGHSNVYIREAIRLCKYLSIGWSGYITLSNDSPNGQMFQENAFVLSIGPDDLRFNIAYDIMRRNTYCSITAMFNTKNTKVNFDKMEIKNPENLNNSNRPDDNVAFVNVKHEKPKQELQYAEVIDIEDPVKESVQ